MIGAWVNFYLIVGTAAAALTGLQFIVQTLLASTAIRPVTGDNPEDGIAAFGSPTVVHLSLSLIVSAIMCAPWPNYGSLRATLGSLGVGALGYAAIVLRRTRRQRSYVPTAYDWFWHILLPAGAYLAVVLGALFVGGGATGALFAIAAAALLLVCVGIHNAWDSVTYLMIAAFRHQAKESAALEPAPIPPQRPRQDNAPRRNRRRH